MPKFVRVYDPLQMPDRVYYLEINRGSPVCYQRRPATGNAEPDFHKLGTVPELARFIAERQADGADVLVVIEGRASWDPCDGALNETRFEPLFEDADASLLGHHL